MDLHDYQDVAENYDKYIDSLVGFSGFDNETCINFNLDLAKRFGEEGIVDVGCGTGLIMQPLIEAGYYVTGLDLSSEMVKQCSNKFDRLGIVKEKYNLIRANMTDFDIGKKASLVLIPRSGFLHLQTSEDQINALKSINTCLIEGGHLSLNTFFPSYDRISDMGHGKKEELFYRTSFLNNNGNNVDIFNSMVYYHDSQLMKGIWHFKEKNNLGEVISEVDRPVTMRWSFKSEMELLFRIAGFEVEEIYGGYDSTEVAYPGQIVWLVKKVKDL